MLPKTNRLPANSKLKAEISIRTPYFNILIAKNEFSYNRFAFVVSKKIDKRATARNRVKRRIRSCIEKMNNDLVQGWDMLFILRKEAILQTTESLNLAIKENFRQKNLLVKN